MGDDMHKLDNSMKDRIEHLLTVEGKSVRQAADIVGCSKSSVSNVVQERNLTCGRPEPKKAAEARDRYNLEGRRELGNELLDRLREMAQDPNLTARDMQALMISFGIAVDKFRLEDGEATGRHEQRYSKELNLEEEFNKLDQELVREAQAKQGPATSEADGASEA
jgi:transposase